MLRRLLVDQLNKKNHDQIKVNRSNPIDIIIKPRPDHCSGYPTTHFNLFFNQLQDQFHDHCCTLSNPTKSYELVVYQILTEDKLRLVMDLLKSSTASASASASVITSMDGGISGGGGSRGSGG